MKKKSIEETKPLMKFNVALQKYEPVLPLSKRKGKEVRFKDAWQWIWIPIICIAILVGFVILLKLGLLDSWVR